MRVQGKNGGRGKLASGLAVLALGGAVSATEAAPLTEAGKAAPAMDNLSKRQAAIPPIAAFMAASDMPRLRTALGAGLDAGLTVSETKEILVHLYAYAGSAQPERVERIDAGAGSAAWARHQG